VVTKDARTALFCDTPSKICFRPRGRRHRRMAEVLSSMRAQSASWRPISRSRSDTMQRPRVQNRPLTPEQLSFIDGYTPRPSQRASPVRLHTYDIGPVRAYTGRRMFSPPFASSRSLNSPTRPDRPAHNSSLGIECRVEQWVEPNATPTKYQLDHAFDAGNGWDGSTYGGVPTVTRRTESRASVFAASSSQGPRFVRPFERHLLQSRDPWEQQETSRSPRWTDWRVRNAGTPSGMGHWD
jgi:hypothetical protein